MSKLCTFLRAEGDARIPPATHIADNGVYTPGQGVDFALQVRTLNQTYVDRIRASVPVLQRLNLIFEM